MSNISWIKKNIIKKMLAALVIVGLLVNMEGVQGIGVLRVRAGVAFPEEVNVSGEIDTSLTYPDDSYCSGVYVIFCETEEKAQNAVSYINDRRSDPLDLETETNAYASYGVVKDSGPSSEASIYAPGQDEDGYSVAKWKKKDDAIITPSDTDFYHYVAVYVAAYDINIIYNTNGGTEISTKSYTPVFENDDDTYSVTLQDEDSTTKEGYRLVGWHGTAPDGDYQPGDTLDITHHFPWLYTLTAVWEEIPTVTVTYRPNGGTGSAVNKTVEFETDAGGYRGTVNLLSSVDFTRDGYTLAGWRVTEPGKTDDVEEFALGSECTFSADSETLVFDAIWERSSVDVSVQYKPNGGIGDVVKQSETIPVSANSSSGQITLLDKADFKRSGYTLTGWSDGNKTYGLGAKYSFSLAADDSSKSLTFDAVWTAKKAGSVEIDIKKPVLVGTKIKYDIEKNSDGDVTVEYKKKGAKDYDYTDKTPKEPGTYTVRATLKETDEYTSAEDTTDFELVYLDAPETPFTYTEIKNSAGTVTDLNVIPASGYSIGLTGAADASFGSSVLYSKAKEAGGVYLKRDKDDAVTEQVQLTTYTVSDKPSVTVTPASAGAGKIYYGTQYNVTATSLSPAEKTITYKKAGAGGTYSAVMPTKPDKYTVRVTAPATDFYAAVDETADFTIEYLEAPAAGVKLKGTPGNGSWYKSDVTLEAPAGYLISTSADGTFGESIKWNEGITELYYQRTSDKAKTGAVQVSFNVKIDKEMPMVVFDSSLGISGKEKSLNVYADSLTFRISDDNLKSVKVNGDLHNVTGKEWTVELKSGLLSETNTIVAADEAGNEYTLEITLSPAWRQSMEVPMGREVCLLAGEGYKLNSKCKLEDKTRDATVYAKGVTVYVREDETCSFTEVDGK